MSLWNDIRIYLTEKTVSHNGSICKLSLWSGIACELPSRSSWYILHEKNKYNFEQIHVYLAKMADAWFHSVFWSTLFVYVQQNVVLKKTKHLIIRFVTDCLQK